MLNALMLASGIWHLATRNSQLKVRSSEFDAECAMRNALLALSNEP